MTYNGVMTDLRARADVHEGTTDALVDAFGRTVTNLRVSVTNRCNFRCVYCHNEGLGATRRPRAPHPDEMTPEEIETRVAVAASLGVRSVKFTGGEPLLREDMEEIARRAARWIPRVSMTTNGFHLAARAAGLSAAGLRRVNVSLDALDPEAFQRIRRGDLAAVLGGIDAALAAGLAPVKINLVVFRETLARIPEMIDFVGRRPGLRLQLIQYMPEQVGKADRGVDIAAVREDLARRARDVIVRDVHRRRIYLIGKAEVELVDPVDNPEFCAHCHRLRLTHDGRLKGCLNRDDDLVPTRGLSVPQIREAFRRVAARRVPYYGVHVKTAAPLPRPA